MDKIKATIKNDTKVISENTNASLINGIISYQEKTNTNVYLDINKDELIRENDQMYMKYVFNKNRRSRGIIFIKDMNKELEIDIETIKLEKKEHKYYVEYKVEENNFIYEIEYMEE